MQSEIFHDSLDAINTTFLSFPQSILFFMINCLEDFVPLEMNFFCSHKFMHEKKIFSQCDEA